MKNGYISPSKSRTTPIINITPWCVRIIIFIMYLGSIHYFITMSCCLDILLIFKMAFTTVKHEKADILCLFNDLQQRGIVFVTRWYHVSCWFILYNTNYLGFQKLMYSNILFVRMFEISKWRPRWPPE